MKTKRIVSVVIAMIMVMAMIPSVSVFAREYAADVSINGITVQFENEPYCEKDIIFVPLEEIGKYLNLDITKEGSIYSIVRMGRTLKMESGNLVAFLDGKEVLLSTNPVEKNSVTYVPVDIFFAGFGCPVTVSEDKRSANIVPNVYRVAIPETNAAAVSAAVPDADILGTGTGSVDAIFNNTAVFPELEKSVFYSIDISPFDNYKIKQVVLNINIDKSEYSPTLRIERTAPWKKGEVTYNTQPLSYESEYVTGGVAESNYVDKRYDITTLANAARKAGEAFSVKLMGIPHSSKKNSKNNSFTIRGVNHAKAPYAEVYLDEEYIFPVKSSVESSENSSAYKYSELALLKTLGVFTENDEFPLDLNEGVQRQEFVKFALRLRNASVSDMDPEGIFTDVPKDAPFCNDVVSAYSLGLVSGGEGVAFRPYDSITIAEAITILGRMLSYNIYADERGGFTPGYFAAARQGKLYLGSASEKGVLSFNKMFKLFEDALDASMLDIQKYNSAGGAEYIFNENMTILSEYWDAKKIEGTVTANEYSNLTPGVPGKDETIVIGTKELKLSFEPYNQFLGYKVRGWYNSEDELLYLGILETDITEVKLQDVEGKSETASTVSFSYIKDNGNRKSETFSKNNVIYNGKSIASSSVKSSLLNADGGSVILVGNSLAIINAYDTVTVYSTEPSEEVIYDKYDSYNNVLRLNGKDYTIRNTEGKELEISELETDDILSVAKSLDGELVSAIVSTKKVTGTITLAENIGTADQVLTIGGNEYETRNLDRIEADSIAEYWTDYIKLGANGTFLIDAFGNIVGFNPVKTTDVKGYIITMDKAGSALSKNLQAAVMVEGSEDYVVYDLADKIKLDGRSQSDSDVILGKFMETVEIDGEEVQRFKTQGIIFDLDANGKINKIDTAYFDAETESEDNSLHLRRSIADGTMRYKNNGSWGGKYYVKLSQGLGVFCYEEGNLEEYQTKTSGLLNDGLYALDLYTVGKETPQAAIAYRKAVAGDSSVGDDPRLLLVDKVVTTFDEEGYEIKKLYYYSGTARGSVIVPDMMVPKLKAKVLASDDPGYAEDPGNPTIVNEVSRGDIIRIEYDDRGELTAIEEAYDYETQKIRYNRLTSFNNLLRTYGGYTGIVSGNYIKVTLDSDITDSGTYSWVDSGKFSNFCRYEVSSTGVDVIPATLKDVRTVKNVPYNPTGILMQSAYENLRANVWLINLPQPEGTGVYKLTYSVADADSVDTTITGIPTEFTRYNLGDFATVGNAVPTRKDHTFAGWQIRGGDGTVYREGDSVAINGDTILEATWVYTPTYEITFKDAVSGLGYSVEWAAKDENLQDKVNNLPDAAAAALQGLKKDGYELIGWKLGSDTYEFGADYLVSGEVTFEAIWMQNWTGTVATTAPETVDGYYMIETGEDLAWFSEQIKTTNTLKAKLANDIYLNNFENNLEVISASQLETWYETAEFVENANNWTEYTIDNFAGEFDGNGKTIYGLYMKGASGTGFFSSVAGGTVKNVTFRGAYLVSTTKTTTSKGTYKNTANFKPVGIVVADASVLGATSTFANITTYGKITATADADVLTAGGIIGKVHSVVNMTDCTSYVDIIDSAKMVQTADDGTTGRTSGVVKCGTGGIIGYIGFSDSGITDATVTLTRCYNYGDIIIPYANSRIGGIVGHYRNGSLNLTGSCGNAGRIRSYSAGSEIVGYRTSSNTTAVAGGTDQLSGGSSAVYDPAEVID